MNRSGIFASLCLLTAACAPSGAPPAKAAPSPAASATPSGPDWKMLKGDLADAAVALASDAALKRPDWTPELAAQPATVVFRNIRVLQGMSAERVAAAMHGMGKALDAKCMFCHDTEDFPSDAKEAKKGARQMLILSARLANDPMFDERGLVTCFTCHHGETKPESKPDDAEARLAKVTLAASLLAVDPKKPAKDVFKNLQVFHNASAGELLTAMRWFSASLGVPCDHCHAADDWSSDTKDDKKFAREMIRLSQQANAFLTGSDGPVTCWTCHRGTHEPEKPGS